MVSLLLILVACYLIGSIPTSIIAGKLLKGIDIREHGSGNAGATNAVRVLGWRIGVGVLLFDMAKGFVAAYYISRIGADNIPLDFSVIQIISGLTAVLGHIWTLFARFRGGKGVATAAGMLFALAPVTILISLAVFGIVAGTTRYISLGSISAAVALSVVMFIRKYGLEQDVATPLLVFSLLVTLLILFTHRSNIKRLVHGAESKFRKQ